MINGQMDTENNRNIINGSEISVPEEILGDKLCSLSDAMLDKENKNVVTAREHLVDEEMETTNAAFISKTIIDAQISKDNEEHLELEDAVIRPTFKKRNCVIQDSDSEEDEVMKKPTTKDTSEENINTTKNVTDVSIHSHNNLDTNIVATENNSESLKNILKKKHKHIAIVDSDSDAEEVNRNNFTETIRNLEAPIYSTNFKGEIILETSGNNASNENRWMGLGDPDSSDEENREDIDIKKGKENTSEDEDVNEAVIKPQPYRKKTRKEGEDAPKKMTGKDAALLKKEIQSESQRMVRERHVSLPYHRPKQFTLKEFLSKRSKLASVVPNPSQLPPSIAIKMSSEQLEIMSKKIEEREIELKEFYKSESESDDENDKEYLPTEEPGPDLANNLNSTSEKSFTLNSNDQEPNVADNTTEKLELNEETANNKNMDTENVHQQNSNEDLLPSDDQLDANVDAYIANNDKSVAVNKQNLHNVNDASEHLKDKSFQFDEIDKEIEQFESNQGDHKEELKLSKIELLRQKLSNIQPRLSGGPNEVIDLETGTTVPDEISRLKERFLQQTAKKATNKNVKLNIVSVENGGEIHKETIAMNVEDDEESTEIEGKPGFRLRKLRDELQSHMAQKRLELWQQKSSKNKENNVSELRDEKNDDKSDYEAGDDILDDYDEEEMSESSEEEEDTEYEVEEEPKKKSAFVDDEAEESERENDLEREVDIDVESNLAENLEDSLSNNSETVITKPIKKPLRRIIKGFMEDSDDDEETTLNNSDTVNNDTTKAKNILLQDDDDDDDDEIPPHQPQNNRTPLRNNSMTQQKQSFDFLTPVSYITGLQNLNNSASKPSKDSQNLSPFPLLHVPSPLRENNWQSNLQKKLFEGDSEITDSQLAEVANLCSTNFTNSESEPFNLDSNSSETRKKNDDISDGAEIMMSCTEPSTQDLLDICSGDFTEAIKTCDQSENIDTESQTVSAEPLSTHNLLDKSFNDSSSKDNLEKTNMETHKLNQTNEVKSLDMDQDIIISQLLDEENMEQFKYKFKSPTFINTQKQLTEEYEEKEVASGGVLDSDDDEEIPGIKRKHKKKLTFSDDESSEDEMENDEEIDLHDEDDDEEEGNDIPADNIGYDSEENEVEYLEEDEGTARPLKASDFFENEAELSESEWGSADEDEKDLDTLDIEQGDAEKFDDKKIRSDLEKIHMRRMLDDDAREVKLLQELLLEDGELHGTGRERQFKWKNIDDAADDTDENKKEDDIYLDDDESEEQWRRKRHEREMFLKEKQKSQLPEDDEDDDLLSDSQFLKIGHRIIQRSNSNSQQNTPLEKVKDVQVEQTINTTLSLFSKRGSFLGRGEQVLQRVARYNKTDVSDGTVGISTAKKSRNFVFQTVSLNEVSVAKQEKKRKAIDGTPHILKKLRLTDNLSPANQKRKSLNKPNTKTKLF